jgi:hypothetical protein
VEVVAKQLRAASLRLLFARFSSEELMAELERRQRELI